MNRAVQSRGSILILVLWCVSLLALFATTLSFGARQKATLLHRLETFQGLYVTAYSGVEKARALLKVEDINPDFDTLGEEWANSPALFNQVPVGDGAFSVAYPSDDETKKGALVYGLIDEERKININKEEPATLKRLLENVGGVQADLAEELSYCLVDWRDSDPTFQHPTLGAEDSTYDDLTVPYQAKDAPFEILDELLLVKGISRDIFLKIKDYLTVYGTGAVNVNTASKQALLALGLSGGLTDKILLFRRGPDQKEATPDDGFFAQSGSIVSDLKKVIQLDMMEGATLTNLISQSKVGTLSSHFTVRSRGVLNKNNASLDIEAVVDRTGKIYYLRSYKIKWSPKV